ncbi:spore germination protein GerW family protein [Streptomycetaceae bacterium NBC_01309]
MASSRDSAPLPDTRADLAATTPAYVEAARVAGTGPGGALLERLAGALGKATAASAVFGEPVTNGGVTVVPVATARFGFGGGAGSGQQDSALGEGGGGGGGAAVTPTGFITIADGTATFTRFRDPWVDVVVPAATAVLVSVGTAVAAQILRRGRGK